MYVNLSDLKHRIEILRPITIEDEMGNLIEKERKVLVKTWAKVLPYAAKIADGYAENVNEISYRIIIRYRTDIEVSDLIQFGNKTLILTGPPYGMDGNQRWLVFECKELVENV